MSKSKKPDVIKGYKVTDPYMTCRSFQFELGKIYKHDGEIELCGAGFHFCIKPNHCFNYYKFTPDNRVFEIEASGTVMHGDDKSVCSDIKLIREIPWAEVLVIANAGISNTGHSNSGDWNSGDSNSGDWNSGNWNSGDRNSGNWNSGYRNSGDSNSGYRNSGAFCTDKDPVMLLFNKPTKMTVREWENTEVCNMMYNIDPAIWVPASIMNDEEKAANPKWETTEGYLKTIPMHEAWANFWHNLTDDKKKKFTSLPNFDAAIFKEITGIDTEK